MEKNRLPELLFFFVLLPLLPLTGWVPRPWFAYLYLAALPVSVWLAKSADFRQRDFWYPAEQARERRELRRLLLRIPAGAIALLLISYLTRPEYLFGLPKKDFRIWIAVMVLYPLFSVYVQELIYRPFLLKRYFPRVPDGWPAALTSGVLFGLAHAAYGGLPSIALAAVGGVMFARTYQKSGSIRLVFLEHAIYGNIIFTVGLERWFYSGWAG